MNAAHERTLGRIRAVLPEYEDEKRLSHTLGVYQECMWMAKCFGLSDEDTYSIGAAALLHDITKNMPDEEALGVCARHRIKPPEASTVMHQYTGAPFARELFGNDVVNDAVYSAIFCHTTGKADMSLLDKILFVADFTEAGRKYRSCKDMREYLHKECEKINKNEKTALYRLLDDITRRIIGFTVTYLVEKGKKIDTGMILAWNAMVSGK